MRRTDIHVTLREIQDIARKLGIERKGPAHIVDLVREIQRKEGNFDCFSTAMEGRCDQCTCLWRNDCFAIAQRL